MNAARTHARDVATRLRVVVLHADAIVSSGLLATLAGEPGIDAARAAAQDNEPALDAAVIVADLRRGLAIMAAHEPGRMPMPKVLVIADEPIEAEVREALRVGALGYITADAPLEEIVRAVRAVGRGSRHLGAGVSRVLQSGLASEALTARETDVLTLLARGLGNKSIARELGIAIGTVKTHLSAVLAKLAASSRCHAVALAARRGLV